MVGPSNLKTLHNLQDFSLKPSSPSSTLSAVKNIKTLIRTLIFSHVWRVVVRALSKTKSLLIEVFEKNQQHIHLFIYPTKKKNNPKKNKKTKIFFGSFRLHYNWCSSHVMPVPAPVLDYYDPTWNSIISTEQQQCDQDAHPDSQLSGYLQWLEAKKENSRDQCESEINEIDRLADMFIANCHEKFRLEKQESYRRFQEMLARGM